MALATVMATVVALVDMKRNLCGQNGAHPMMTDRLTDTVMQIHTEFRQLIAHQRSQVLTVEELPVRFVIRCFDNVFNVLKVWHYEVS